MTTPSPRPKKKKLPFKPTALRRPLAPPASSASPTDPTVNSKEDGQDGLALFRRGNEMAPRLTADLERRLKKKQDKLLKEESERRRSSGAGEKRPYDEAHMDAEGHDMVTGENTAATHIGTTDDGHTSSPSANKSDHHSSTPITPPPSKRSRNAIPSEAQLSSPIIAISENQQPSPPKASAPIVLSDSDTSPSPPSPPSRAAVHPPRREPSIEIVDNNPDDDEFSEYVQKAAAARASLRQEQLRDSSRPSSASATNLPVRAAFSSSLSTPPATAEILVTSSIPDSVPCKALVRFDQPLRLLRDSWAAKQRKAGLDVPESSAILTWRRARVYNTSTLLHLGLRPRNDGRISTDRSSTGAGRNLSRSFSSSTDQDSGLNEDRTRVHFEAWTQESFLQMESSSQQHQHHDASHPSSPSHPSHHPPSPSPEPEIKLRILLRSRGLPDIGLTVRPATTVETLITGFRRQLSATNPDVSSNQGITLWFDGEQLEEHATLEEMDIDDRDIIEVHLKEAA